MIVFACRNCKYTDLFEDEEHESGRCPRCGGTMVSLGIGSADWNMLGIEEIYDLINEKVGTEADDTEYDAGRDYDRIEDQGTAEAYDAGHGGPNSYVDTEGGPEAVPEDAVRDMPDTPVNMPEDLSGSVGHRSGSKVIYYDGRSDAGRGALPDDKGRFRRMILGIGIAFAAAAVVCTVLAVNAHLKEKDGIGAAYRVPGDIEMSASAVTDETADDTVEYPVYEFENCLFYDAMSDREKEFYQIFYDLVMHKDEADYSRSINMPVAEFETVRATIPMIYTAMIKDHPEFFFLDVSKGRQLGMDGFADDVSASVVFTLEPGDANENEMIAKFDAAVDSFMRKIDKNASEAEIEMQIHDRLNDMVSYDRELLALGLDASDPAHTAYGALVDNGRGVKHRAVCDGYAAAFQYLLGKAGICAAQVIGDADTPGGTLWGNAYHAWNIVRLDGEWYEVDSCWDDLEIDEMRDFYLAKEIKKIEDKYFYTEHHWYNRTTEEMENLAASERTRFFIPGYESFNFIEETSHVRHVEPDVEWYPTFEYLNNYLPEATGTKYAL